MSTLSLAATSRKEIGKQFAKRTRREGNIPAVLYGKSGNVSLVVNPKELGNLLSSATKRNTVIKLNYTGEASGEVFTVVTEIQRHPLSRNVIHADFKEIDLKDTLVTKVPVVLEGIAAGLKMDGGTLSFRVKSLNVEALPEAVPANFALNVTPLRAGHGLKVSDVEAASGIKFLDDPDTIIVFVAMPRLEEVKEVEEFEMI